MYHVFIQFYSKQHITIDIDPHIYEHRYFINTKYVVSTLKRNTHVVRCGCYMFP